MTLGDESQHLSRVLITLGGHAGGRTAKLAAAVAAGLLSVDAAIEVRAKPALETTADDVLWADGLILGTPEHFGYMSGALKDFFDRTYYALEERSVGKPWALFVSAGNDGRGTVGAVQRIVLGYRWTQIAEALVIVGEPDESALLRCHELGATMAAGLDAGVF